MQPTADGRLHLGNYEGALRNWVRLQDDYEMFSVIVDWHALTTGFKDPARITESVLQTATDYLAAGLDPEKCVIFVQSSVKEHAELYLLFGMFTPLGWLERVPTYKEKIEQLDTKEIMTHGFLGYPVLQAADILIYRAGYVPVGKDQLPHLELSREITRRFNHLYGKIFQEPEPLLTDVPILPGTDGRKMSKSYGNQILMSETRKSLKQKISGMFTDPEKIRKNDKGHPEHCPIYLWQQVYNSEHEEIFEPCATGSDRWGCVACKKKLADCVWSIMEPIRERREYYESHPEKVEEILADGSGRARREASMTMEIVCDTMKLGNRYSPSPGKQERG